MHLNVISPLFGGCPINLRNNIYFQSLHFNINEASPNIAEHPFMFKWTFVQEQSFQRVNGDFALHQHDAIARAWKPE